MAVVIWTTVRKNILSFRFYNHFLKNTGAVSYATVLQLDYKLAVIKQGV